MQEGTIEAEADGLPPSTAEQVHTDQEPQLQTQTLEQEVQEAAAVGGEEAQLALALQPSQGRPLPSALCTV